MKKVLIITYYWPPAGGPGVQRVLKFVKYLPEYGWKPIVLTVENGNYPAYDESLIDEIPSGCIIYKTKTWEPFSFYLKINRKLSNNIPTHILETTKEETFFSSIARFIRLNFFIPDPRKGWIRCIVKEGKRMIEKYKPDLIFSSSPPHSVQLGAMKLARKTGLKWIADFRDPWTDYFNLQGKGMLSVTKKKLGKMEESVVKNCNLISSVSQGVGDLLMKSKSKDLKVIYNGYDEDDFTELKKNRSDKWRICYAGSIRKSQTPLNFLLALKKLPRDVFNTIEFDIYGSVHPEIRKTIIELGLKKILRINPYLKHKFVVGKILNADLLILLIPAHKKNHGIITGKIFEYLRTGNPILGIGPIEGEAAQILESTNRGKMYDYEEDFNNVLLNLYKNWKNCKGKSNILNDINFYSRKHQTRELARQFDLLRN